MTIKIAIAGVAGRMGQALVAASHDDARFEAVAGSEKASSTAIGALVGGVMVYGDAEQAAAHADAWLDFTHPVATLAALDALVATSVKAIVIGTTGFDGAGEAAIKAASVHFAIVRSGNFSLGVNLVAGLVRQAAARLGPDWDAEIIEAHHRRKVDAPSGTALMLGRAVAHGREIEHDAHAQWARHGQTGARKAGDIGYAVVRAGGIIGDHQVLFASDDEQVSISHHASNRTIFARGALVAAAWAVDQPPGLYDMSDVLGI